MEKSGLPTIFDAKTKTPLTIIEELSDVFLSEQGPVTITPEIQEEYKKISYKYTQRHNETTRIYSSNLRKTFCARSS